MTEDPAPIRTEYVGIIDETHVWRVWRTDTNEPIGWNVSPIDTDHVNQTEASATD
jgi:hypothetical protein